MSRSVAARFVPLMPMAFLAALSACGGKDETTLTVDDGNSGEATVTMSETGENGGTMKIEAENGEMVATTGDQASTQMPFGLTIYPGATVTMNMQTKQDGKEGAMISFTAKAPPKAIAEHYKAFATSSGFKIDAEATMNDAVTFAAKKPSGEAFQVTAQPDTSDGSGLSQVTIIAGMGG